MLPVSPVWFGLGDRWSLRLRLLLGVFYFWDEGIYSTYFSGVCRISGEGVCNLVFSISLEALLAKVKTSWLACKDSEAWRAAFTAYFVSLALSLALDNVVRPFLLDKLLSVIGLALAYILSVFAIALGVSTNILLIFLVEALSCLGVL